MVGDKVLDPQTRAFYTRTLAVLNESDTEFLIGGAYAFALYTGIERHTKDLDVFTRRADRDRVLGALEAAGYRTEVTFPHWLGKAYGDDGFVDVIYSSGNGIGPVDDEWFAHAVDGRLLGIPVRLVPAEEMIWQKAYIMERERFDGADVAHVIRSRGEQLDWDRLLRRFGPHYRVLLGHLVLFGFTYPAERGVVPDSVLHGLLDRLKSEAPEAVNGQGKTCRGTFLSREQYLMDIGRWGYRDARLKPDGPMAPEEVEHWTAAIATK